MALPNSRRLNLLLRATLGLYVLTAFGHLACAQETRLIVAPVSKLEALELVDPLTFLSANAIFAPEPRLIAAPPPKVAVPAPARRSRFALDRTAIAFGLVQGGSEFFDGVTTKYFLHHCSSCVEIDPISHFLLGSKPSWPGMIAAGSIEAFAVTYLHQGMRHSPHKFIRRCAPLAPLLLIGMHVVEGARNLPLKNLYYCTDPSYIVVASRCVPPPSAQTGGGGPSMPGRSRDPVRPLSLHFK